MNERHYNLRDDSVKMVEYSPELHESVERAALAWQEFCALPDTIKQKFASHDEQWTIGYESKDGSGANGDKKENFDFSKHGTEDLRAVLATIDNETVSRFVTSVEALVVQTAPMIESFGYDLEKDEQIEGFGALAKESVANAFLRFLHYPSGQAVGGTIAEPHVDHSGFTFHLFETTDGCERRTHDGKWLSLPVAIGQAASFASMQAQLATHGEIKALAHRVVANETSSRMGRFAIVCFVALSNTPTYDRAAHGRLQEMTPGFNYTMPYEEFRNLFRQV